MSEAQKDTRDMMAVFIESLAGADRVVVETKNALGEMDAHYMYAPAILDAWNTRQAPKVKALEWERRQREPNFCWANLGDYYVDQAPDGTWYCHGPDGPICKKSPSCDAAKAAAQADYERRILSALEE